MTPRGQERPPAQESVRNVPLFVLRCAVEAMERVRRCIDFEAAQAPHDSEQYIPSCECAACRLVAAGDALREFLK